MLLPVASKTKVAADYTGQERVAPKSLANGLAFVSLVSRSALTNWNAHQDSWIPLRNSQTRKAAMSRPRLHIRNGTGKNSPSADMAGKDTGPSPTSARSFSFGVAGR